VLADAVNQAKGTGGVFTPHQLNMKDAQSALKLTGNIASASGNRPFADLAAAGQQVLPSKLGDSGTFKRMLVGGLATGALGGVAPFSTAGKALLEAPAWALEPCSCLPLEARSPLSAS
jgi:hypothetical protein